MKEFTINNYLEDIRKKIPAYDLMLEIIFNSLLKIETDILQIKNILAIGGQSFEAKNLSEIYELCQNTRDFSREMNGIFFLFTKNLK